MNQAETFKALFAGRTDAFGTGKGGVVHSEPTLALYQAHLEGTDIHGGIGIFPIRDDATVTFAAIDLDEPNFGLAKQLTKLIPGRSFIERSRSGNAHVWVFFGRPCPAWAARAVLQGATEAVGRPEVEVFPKQDRVREGGVGNYINLPYRGGERPVVWVDGAGDSVELGPVPLHAFITDAEGSLQKQDEWVRRARQLGGRPPEEREDVSEFGTAPVLHMCAEHIIANRESNPLTKGSRHQVLFHLAKQLLNYRDYTAEEAWYMLELVNNAGNPPVGRHELERIFENAKTGQFVSTGCDDPLMQPYVHPNCPIAHP